MNNPYPGSNNKNFKGIFMTAVGIVGFSVVGLILFVLSNPTVQTDAFNCPVDRSFINKKYSYIFDTTEPLAPSQMVDITNRVLANIRDLKEYDLIRFYTVESAELSGIQQVTTNIDIGDTTTQVDQFCMPSVSDWNSSPISQTLRQRIPEMLAINVLGEIDNESEQSNSPIIDALRYVAADDDRIIPEQQIYVISDMLENSNILSMYGANWYEDQYLLNRQRVLDQRPIFREGTSITIFQIMRPRINIRQDELAQFWGQILLGTSNANNIPPPELIRITGGL